ncbi:hypothetical protein B9Z55_028472 [Caenorhabditis nigoni]|nr:hypothetical protein B9Z55_028469 [Caenorhabditis nigoni]PIC12329.1 hypothetical protein B9Z55_028472 [Caenorhabditis nigoni]
MKETEEQPKTDKKQLDMAHHFKEHQKDNFSIGLAEECELEEDDTWILDSLMFLEHCRKTIASLHIKKIVPKLSK